MSAKEVDRLHWMRLLAEHRTTQREAAEALSLTTRHLRRLVRPRPSPPVHAPLGVRNRQSWLAPTALSLSTCSVFFNPIWLVPPSELEPDPAGEPAGGLGADREAVGDPPARAASQVALPED